ncbi:GNAT family N-acetyltransferase [Thermodesulfobacteriota bacterium]
MSINKSPFLDGERIYFREVRISDVNENYYSWMNDPEVNQYLETRYIPQSRENIKRYVEKMDGKRPKILDVFLKEIGMTEEEFNQITRRHVVPRSES